MGGWDAAWIKVSLVSTFLVGALGAAIRKRLTAMRVNQKFENNVVRKFLADPLSGMLARVRGMVSLGIVLLMVARPAGNVALTVMGASAFTGLIWGALGVKSWGRESLKRPGVF